MLKIRDFLFLLFYLLFTVSNAYAIPPAAPKIDKNIVIEDGSVTLNWAAVSGADSYNLYRGLKSGAETLIKNKIKDTKVTIPGVNGTQYFFKLKAVNSAGEESPFSNEVSAILTLSKPQIKVIQIATGRVMIGWPAINGATNYFIYESTTQNNPSPKQLTGFAINLNKTTNEYYVTISALTINETHYFKIKAVNAEEINEFSSDFSNEITVVALGAPNTPVLISAVPGPKQITLNWSPTVGAATYNVYQGTVAGGEGITPVSENIKETSTIISNLNNGTQYFFKITAENPGGKSAFSNELSATPTNPDGILISKITLTVGSKNLVADGKSRILLRAAVEEVSDKKKPAVGVTVQFSTGAGNLFSEFLGGEQTDKSITDSNGIAQLFLQSPTRIGTTIVRANANGVISDDIELKFIAGVLNSISLTATPITVNILGTASLRATALDINGNPVTDAINFEFVKNTSGASISVTSNDNGVTLATYNAGFKVGQDIIQATANGKISNQIEITVNSVIGTINLEARPQQVIADGKNKVEINATVKEKDQEDKIGNPAVGVTVNFAATEGILQNAAGQLATTAQTDSSGIAKLYLVAPTYTSTSTVRATISSISATATVNFIAGPASQIILTANPATVNSRGESTIQARFEDAWNNPIVGKIIDFKINPNNSGATLDASTKTTDSNGQVTINYTAGGIGGTDTIQAQLRNGIQETVQILVNAPVVNKIELKPGSDQIIADGKSTAAIRATVTDIDGNPVERASVFFSTTAGKLSANTANTNGSGIAEVTLTAANRLGKATLTASIAGFTDNKIVEFIAGAPAQISLIATPRTLNLYGETTLQATVFDANGNPVKEEIVIFSVAPNNSGGNLEAVTKATDENGRAEVKYTAGDKGGNDTIMVRVANGKTDNLIIAVNEPLISEIKISTGAESIVADGKSIVAVRATVTDNEKNLTQGVKVNFTTTAGNLSAKQALTNSQGVAEVNLIAPTRIGNATITASASGFTDSATVKFTAGRPDKVELTPQSINLNPGESTTIQITVSDAKGNPVEKETLNFSINPNASNGILEKVTAITDVNGRAEIKYTAGNKNGNDTIRAQTSNGKLSTTTINVGSASVNEAVSLALSYSNVKDDNTNYKLPMTVLVSDIKGNPVPNAEIILSVWPIKYATGIRDHTDNNGKNNGSAIISDTFLNEDINEDVSLGADEIDFNGDGILTPPNSSAGAIPHKVTTNNTGIANFDLIYPKTSAEWITVRISATTDPDKDINTKNDINSKLEIPLPAIANDIFGTNPSDNGIGGTLNDSPYNATCPYEIKATPETIYVEPGNNSTVTLTLTGKNAAATSKINGRPVTALAVNKKDIDYESGSTSSGSTSTTTSSKSLNLTATSGTTKSDGTFESTVSIPAEITDTAFLGMGTTIDYFGSCAHTTVNLIVGSQQIPEKLTLSAAPARIPLNGTSTISAYVSDNKNQPVNAQWINFTIKTNNTGGTFSGIITSAIKTGEDGKAIITYNSGSKVGTDTIVASTTGENIKTDEIDITVDPKATVISTLELKAMSESVVADGVSTVAIRATVTDSAKNPAVGITVNFATTAGKLSANSAITTDAGFAEVKLTAPQRLGNATITASVAGFTDTATVKFTAGAPQNITLTQPLTDVNPESSVDLIASVTDSYKNPVADETVTFLLTEKGSINPSLSAITAITNKNGQAGITYTAGKNVGTDSVKAKTTNGKTEEVSISVSTPTAARLALSTNNVAVKSDNSDSVIITATVLDGNNAVLSGVNVKFSADGGEINAASGVTDKDGKVSVKFSAGEDQTNRVANISATIKPIGVPEITRKIPIQIIGTTLKLTALNTALSTDKNLIIPVEVLLSNYAGQPIFDTLVCFSVEKTEGGDLTLMEDSDIHPELTTPCPIPGISGVLAANDSNKDIKDIKNGKTNVTGQIKIKVSGKTTGKPKLIAYGAGATATQQFIVKTKEETLKIIEPNKTPLPVSDIGTTQKVTVNALGVDKVRFATSLGTWQENSSSVVEISTINGLASAILNATTAGNATVVVTDVNDAVSSDTVNIIFTVPLKNAAKLLFQASPRVIPVSSGTVKYNSELTAVVLTNQDQPVVNAPVAFTMISSTGGGETISKPLVFTDNTGTATTTFISGERATPASGLIIQASVLDTVLKEEFKIVISNRAGSLILSIPKEASAGSEVNTYKLPITILVADVNGNPVANNEVSLSIWPKQYSTGRINFPPNIGDDYKVDTQALIISDTFDNEDLNENLINDDDDDDDEDINGDSVLTPRNSAGGVAPRTVTTDASGLKTFDLTYPTNSAGWIVDRIRASTKVEGTEIIAEENVRFPGVPIGSIYEATCPFDVTASKEEIYIRPGGDSSVTFTLKPKHEKVNKVKVEKLLKDRPVIAIVHNKFLYSTLAGTVWLDATASQGKTDDAGEFTSIIDLPPRSRAEGKDTFIDYFVSCAYKRIRIISSSKDLSFKPEKINITAVPKAVAPNRNSTVTAYVFDINNNPLIGEDVIFKFTQNQSGATLSGITTTTDASGKAGVTYTSGLNLCGDSSCTDIISVETFRKSEDEKTVTNDIDIKVNPDAANLEPIEIIMGTDKITADGNKITADGKTQLSIQAKVMDKAKDSEGNSLPVVGLKINFSTTGGTLSALSALTNSFGIAEVLLTAPTRTGNAIISVQAKGFNAAQEIEFIAGAPANLTLTEPPTEVNTGSKVQLEATLSDEYGNAVEKSIITFRIIEVNSGAPILSNITVITEKNGVAKTEYTAGEKIGIDKIQAQTVGLEKVIQIKVIAPVAAHLALSTNKVAVKSDNSDSDTADSATITATVLDDKNALIPGMTVSFSATGGQISSSSAVTDKDGKSEVIFSAGDDPTNRIAIITASIIPIGASKAIIRQIPIQIIGTSVKITAPSTSLPNDGTEPITVEVLVTNAANQPVFDTPVCFTIDKSENGDLTLMEDSDTHPELITPCPIAGISGVLAANDINKDIKDIKKGKTDVTGRLKIKVAGKTTGKPKLIAYSAGASDTQQFIVDPMNLKITTPNKTSIPALNIGKTQEIIVNAPGAKRVKFSTSLGNWQDGKPVTTVDVDKGTAKATLTSAIAGTATVLVSDAKNYLSSDTITILFTTPFNSADAKLLFQAAPRVVSVSAGTVKYTSTLTAVLLTKNDDQAIANVPISFTMLSGTGSGETITPPLVITDLAGKATATFTSGASATSADGLIIQASVPGTSLKKNFKMVVTDKAGSLILGVSNLLKTEASDTVYTLPMTVLVADANGNPVSHSEVSLSIWPLQYSSGIRDRIDYDSVYNGAAIITDTFDNEDYRNENLILDKNEDFNGDERLTPPNSAAGNLPQKVTTDASGLASFNLIYPKSSAEWIVDRIRASTFVQGSEMLSEFILRLPALEKDIFGEQSPSDTGIGGTLGNSPYNSVCPYQVTASKETLYVAPGGSNSITLTLKGIKGKANTQLTDHPVTALIENKAINYTAATTITWLNATASIGKTDIDGKFISSVVIPNNIYAIGITTPIHYFVSCASVTINLVASDPALSEKPSEIILSAQPNIVAPNGDAVISAYVLDGSKNPLQGQRVNFSILPNVSGATLNESNAITDANGKAKITYTAGSDSGKDTIVVSTTGDSPITNQVQININSDAVAVKSIDITTGADEIPVGAGIPVTIRATVKDINDKLAAGVPVTFTTTAGTFQNAAAPGNTIQINTNAKGLATAMLLSGNEVGTAVIRANANGFVSSTEVNFTVGSAAEIKLNATPNVVTTSSGTSTIVATVVDSYGNGIGADQKIRFSVTGGGTITLQGTTDDTSQAQVTYTAGATAGLVTITATLTNGVIGTTNLTVKDSVMVVSLTSTKNTLPADGVSQTVITATITNTTAQPISNKPLTFSATDGILSAVSAITNAKGQAQITLTAPTVVGNTTVTAKVDNVDTVTQLTFIAGPPNTITINLSPTIVNPSGATNVTATVKDTQGNLVPGANLTFTAVKNNSKGKFVAKTATTNILGQATVKYIAGAAINEVTDTLQVTLKSDATITNSAYLTIAPGAIIVGTVTLETGSDNLPADGKSIMTVRAIVLDKDQKKAPGVPVSFITTAGTIKPTQVITDANGIASVQLTSPPIVSSAVVTAEANGVRSNSKIVQFTAGVPSKITLNAAPLKVRTNGTTTLNATVLDAQNSSVKGVIVNFSLTKNKSGGNLKAVYSTTDDNGQAEMTYTAGSKNGIDQLTAKLSNGKSSTVDITVNANATVVDSIKLNPGAASVIADGKNKVAIRAVVEDNEKNKAVGVEVTFSTTSGKITATAITDSNGVAEVFLTASKIAGTAIITGSVNGFSGITKVSFIAGIPTQINLTATPNIINTNGTTSILATVFDANKNIVTGERLSFSIPTNKSGGNLDQLSVITNDTNGQAKVIYTAGSKAGTDKIQAELSNGVKSTVSITVKGLAVKSINVFTATSIIADGAKQATVQALVYDTANNLVPNVTVNFTTTNGSLSAESAKTDHNGNAKVFLTAPTKIGSANIIATTGTIAGNTTIQFVAGPAALITLNANPLTIAPTAQTTITAIVTDANGNPVEKDNLRFTLSTNNSNGSLSTTSGETDSDGTVKNVIYTAGIAGGGSVITDTISVTDTSVDSSILVPVTQDISVDPKTIILNSLTLTVVNGISTLTADGESTALLRATVQQIGNTAASGIKIDFGATSGTLSAESAITDANGIADVILTAPEKTATATLTAKTSGMVASNTLSFIAGAPDLTKSSLTANPATLAADGTSISTITVILADAKGNLIADDTSVRLVTTAGTITSENPTKTLSGRATFTIKAPTTPTSTTLSIAQLPELTTDVNFGSASTGNPASINLVVGANRISVAGIGQNENTTLSIQIKDDAGNPIDESKYPDVNNIRVSFVTQPHGGEYIGGVNAAKSVCTTLTGGDNTTCPGTEAGPIYLRTTKGSLTMNIQAGTLPGILEGKIEVILDKDGVELINPITASLPQVVIASGPPHTITLTSQATDSLENPKKGVYRLKGTAVVTDRYGNNVPDGTAINLGLIDSVLAQGTGGIIAAGVNTLTGGTSLITSDLGETFDFLYQLKRNNTNRGIQVKDRVLIENAQAGDKNRFVNEVPTAGDTLTVQSNYLGEQSDAIYTVGASLLGGSIAGIDANGKLTVGTAITQDGLAEFAITYPANNKTILVGCFGYGTDSALDPLAYSTEDKRYEVPQSAQVYLVAASSDNSAITIDKGNFCFKALLPIALTANPTKVGTGTTTVSLSLTDKNLIALPLQPVTCSLIKSNITMDFYDKDTDTLLLDNPISNKTDINGNTSITVKVEEGTESSSGTISCSSGTAVVDITVTVPAPPTTTTTP